MSYNPISRLEEVKENYLRTKEAIKIASKVIDSGDFQYLRGSSLLMVREEELENWRRRYLKDSENYYILSLWAEFEHIVIEYIQDRIRIVSTGDPERFARQLCDKLNSEIAERWNVDNRLDLLKSIIDPEIIGLVKQVKLVRHSIAHSSREEPAINLLPDAVYSRLRAIIIRLYPDSIRNREAFE